MAEEKGLGYYTYKQGVTKRGGQRLLERDLDKTLWGIKRHLFVGAKILDVGCGPGTITVDVASVEPGPDLVVGVDSSEKMIEQATEHAAQSRASNVTFRVTDAYALEIADGEFDITYSNALFDWLTDPCKALNEQRRVTKKGGVVFARIGDTDSQLTYPECPTLAKHLGAYRHLRGGTDVDTHWDPFLGKRALALFSEAGLTSIEMEGWADCHYPGSPDFDRQFANFERPATKPYHPIAQKLLDWGLVDEADFEKAVDEVRAWRQHPHAFSMRSGVFITGKVS